MIVLVDGGGDHARSRGGPFFEGGACCLLRKGAVSGVRGSRGCLLCVRLRRRLSPRVCGWLSLSAAGHSVSGGAADVTVCPQKDLLPSAGCVVIYRICRRIAGSP